MTKREKEEEPKKKKSFWKTKTFWINLFFFVNEIIKILPATKDLPIPTIPTEMTAAIVPVANMALRRVTKHPVVFKTNNVDKSENESDEEGDLPPMPRPEMSKNKRVY